MKIIILYIVTKYRTFIRNITQPENINFLRRQRTVVEDYFINQIHQQKRIVFVIFNNDYFQFIKLQNPKEPPFQLCHYYSEYMPYDKYRE